MIAKYNIEYALRFGRHTHPHHYLTDDPVAAEEFLLELLERGFKILSIHHEGVVLPQKEADVLIKRAASMLAARHLRQSLDLTAEEERFRFGFSA
jgi:hypothetical protein